MSLAQGQTTIHWTSKGATYNAYVTCAWGDLYQYWSGAAGSYAYTPQYENMPSASQPVLVLHVTSSRGSDSLAVNIPDIEIDGVAVTFGSNGISTGAWAGVFERVTVDGEPGLKVKKIFGNECGRASFTIAFKTNCYVNGSNKPDRIVATYNVQVSQGTADDVKAMIYETPVSGKLTEFTIRDTADTCRLGVKLMRGNDQILSGIAYHWQRYDAATSAWVDTDINGTALGTLATLDVTEAMVNTYEVFRIIATYDGNEYYDTQGVWDAQDPYEIYVETFPEDATIQEGDTGAAVKLFPKVVKRADHTAMTGADWQKFKFAVYDSLGVVRNADSNTVYNYVGKPVAENTNGVFAVTYGLMSQIGSDVQVAITLAD